MSGAWTDHEEVTSWLRDLLPMPAERVRERAMAVGIPMRVLENARRTLGVVFQQDHEKVWWWSL